MAKLTNHGDTHWATRVNGITVFIRPGENEIPDELTSGLLGQIQDRINSGEYEIISLVQEGESSASTPIPLVQEDSPSILSLSSKKAIEAIREIDDIDKLLYLHDDEIEEKNRSTVLTVIAERIHELEATQ